MSQGAASRRIKEQLRKLLRDKHGQVREVEQQVGRSRGSFARWVRGARPLTTEKLDQILDGFGVAPGEFFAEAFELQPPEVGSGAWLLEVLGLDGPGEPPVKIRELRRAKCALPPIDDTSAESPTLPNDISTQLEEQDELRYSDPQSAARLAHKLAMGCPTLPLPPILVQEAFSRAVGAYASAHRIAASHTKSAYALALVSSGKDGDLLQRLSMLLVSCARFDEALRVNSQAMTIWLDASDRNRMGQVCVHRGVIQMLSGDADASRRSFEAAAGLLSPDDRRYWIAIYEGFAQLALYAESNSQAALEQLDKAQPLIAKEDLYNIGMMAWFRGAVSRQESHYESAEKSFREAQAHLWALNVFDWALCTLDLIEVILEQGRAAEASRTALVVARLLEPKSSNKIAAAAMARLLEIRRASAAGIDAAAIQVTRDAILESRRLGLVRS